MSKPFRFVVISDLHPDVHTLGVSRFPEVEKAYDQAVDYAIAQKVDAFLFLGDLVDPDSGSDTMKAIAMMIRGSVNLVQHGIRVILIGGNHCVEEDGGGATVLTPIRALQDACVFAPPGWEKTRNETMLSYADTPLHVVEEPEVVWLRDDIAFMCLPFTPVSRGVDMKKFASEEWPMDGSKVVVAAHLSVPGIIPGEETAEMPRGREVAFPFEETRLATLRFNGHYHRKQVFDPQDGGPPIIVPGSLVRLTFGEQDHTPSFIEVEI